MTPIAWALVIGGLWMLGAEALAARQPDRRQVTWPVAILVGVAQMVAGIFPGTSRSAASIFAAMLAGTSNRAAATEFSFLVGIPTMYAATGYELLKVVKGGGIAGEDWSALLVGFVVSAIVAFVAVKWLLGYIRSHRFTPFAIYRIALRRGAVAAAARRRLSRAARRRSPRQVSGAARRFGAGHFVPRAVASTAPASLVRSNSSRTHSMNACTRAERCFFCG